MGIESDHLVYEYLSRVGDLAQRRQLSSGDRMRLVSGLRDEIDRRRAKFEPDTPAAVRSILERIGTPEEVLDTVRSARAAPAPAPGVPAQRGSTPSTAPGSTPPGSTPPQNVPPHLAGLDELGDSAGAEPDWWSLAPGASGAGPQVEGFAGGIEIPDLFRDPEEAKAEKAAKEAADTPPAGPPAPGGLVRFLRDRRERKKAAAPEAPPAPARQPRPRPHPFLLLAAALLLAGALTGYWPLLGAGALVAYASRVLGPRERKWVILGLPAAVFTLAMLWLWGRSTGRWGDPLPGDQVGPAFQSLWPTLARTAGAMVAAYLGWRSRRR
ncbi:hypothetical protein [Streptomyces sp. NBC_00091]|uniref:hypothetical protein n=1 Tax=Streptomyces sp. NBC_00091 TaxID=2975648 RepID=UPI0022549888|nr:hypothetical protein [Streptomyces sp. NBC_00091]MCX5376818.1 hypothetical protein [Streptomyces sp. NBC_00091]